MCDKPVYHSYMLRLRPQKGRGLLTWSVSLQDVQTGERLGFASLQALFEYLSQVTQRLPAAGNNLPAVEDDRTKGVEREYPGEET